MPNTRKWETKQAARAWLEGAIVRADASVLADSLKRLYRAALSDLDKAPEVGTSVSAPSLDLRGPYKVTGYDTDQRLSLLVIFGREDNAAYLGELKRA